MLKKTSKSPPEKKKGKKVEAPSITRHENDLWRDLTYGTQKKFCTVEPHHNAPQPASPEFLKNYEEIFGHE